jgi:hypothetical protein
MKSVLLSWGASAILAPIMLGLLGVFWATYNDVLELKASEVQRVERIDRLERSYEGDISEVKTKLDKVYDILINARQFRKVKDRE